MGKKLTDLEKVAKIWQIQLNIEYEKPEKNVRLSFNDIGSFCEHLATDYYNGFVGSGSGGMGLDLRNFTAKKTIECKACCTIQNSKCKQCSEKFNSLFLDKCPQCDSVNFREMKDSRFSINAKELLKQLEAGIFENLTLCHISLGGIDKTKKEITVIMHWFRVDFSDNDIKDNQLEYFRNQVNYGKANTCNLLPDSFDFFKLNPTQFSEAKIIIRYDDISKLPTISQTDKSDPLLVPEKIIPPDKRADFRELESYKDGFASVKDFTKHIPYKTKSLGKERGDTRRSVYGKLK